MNTASQPSASRQNLSSDYLAEETRKSNLLLEAALLREQGRTEEAASHFAGAAAMEERLAQRAEEQGDVERALRHQYSAASGWAQAGDFYHALALLLAIIERSDTPSALRERVQTFTETVRGQRDQWYAALRQANLT